MATAFALPGFHEPWGKDAGIDFEDTEAQVEMQPTYSVLVRAFEKVQLFHQNIISPVDGPRSHFRPTSSKYMLLAMQRHGFIKGFVMGCDRLLRENDDDWVIVQNSSMENSTSGILFPNRDQSLCRNGIC